MNDPSQDSKTNACPECGGRLSRLPTVDGDGYLLVCDRCDYQRVLQRPPEPQPESDQSARSDDTARFRRLLAEGEATERDEDWPDELLEDLPPEARQALETKRDAPEPSPRDEGVPDRVTRTLMDYGFAVDEDARGLRLRSAGGLRRPGTGDLSAHDVVRLASELGGAPPPPEERRACPKCKAMVPRTATRCQWCDAELSPEEDDS
jgi:hypothetical protein